MAISNARIDELCHVTEMLCFCREAGTPGFQRAAELVRSYLSKRGLPHIQRDVFSWPHWSVTRRKLEAQADAGVVSLPLVPIASAGPTRPGGATGRAVVVSGKPEADRLDQTNKVPVHKDIPPVSRYQTLAGQNAAAQLCAVSDAYFRELPYCQLGEKYFEGGSRCPMALIRRSDLVRLKDRWVTLSIAAVRDGAAHENLYVDIGPPGVDVSTLVVAHLDSAPFSPGAQDNATGCAISMLLAAESVGCAVSKRIRFLWTTGEELDFFGAQIHLDRHQAELAKDAFVIDVDPMCSKGAAKTRMLVVGDHRFLRWVQGVNAKLSVPCDVDMAVGDLDGSDSGEAPLNCDLTPFAIQGIPGFCLHRGARGTSAHTPDDTFERVSPEGLDELYAQCLELLFRSTCDVRGSASPWSVPESSVKALMRYMKNHPGL